MNFKNSRKWTLPLILVALIGLVGCASRVMKQGFSSYGDMYAQAENEQLLLNLARLSQHHPTYFFQLGNINALYEYTGSLSASGGESDKSTALALAGATTKAATGSGGTGGASYQAASTVGKVPLISWILGGVTGTATTSSKPTFQYVPLNGSEFSAHLITPLRADVFHDLFRDGFPVDILMRALVQEVRFSGANGKNLVILQNNATGKNMRNYVTFLRMCGILKELQDNGYLTEKLKVSGQVNRTPAISQEPLARDLMDAMTNKLTWSTNANGKWQLETKKEDNSSLSFELAPGAEAFLDKLATETPYDAVITNSDRGQLIQNLKMVLAAGEDSTNFDVQVEFRSTMFVLYNMANEQAQFEQLYKCGPTNLVSTNLFSMSFIPQSQFRPILSLKKEPGEKKGPALAKVHYEGEEYEIADAKDSTADRDAFLLAATLLTQMSIDPAKLNYQPQLLQVR